MSVTITGDFSIDNMLALRASIKQTLDSLDNELLKVLTLWQSKATNGYVVEAIIQVRKEKNCSLREAKDIVDSFLKG